MKCNKGSELEFTTMQLQLHCSQSFSSLFLSSNNVSQQPAGSKHKMDETGFKWAPLRITPIATRWQCEEALLGSSVQEINDNTLRLLLLSW